MPLNHGRRADLSWPSHIIMTRFRAELRAGDGTDLYAVDMCGLDIAIRSLTHSLFLLNHIR